MDSQDYADRLNTSMAVLGKRLEVMKKRNEASLLNNEILALESELRVLEFQQEEGATNEEPGSEERLRMTTNVSEQMPGNEQMPRRAQVRSQGVNIGRGGICLIFPEVEGLILMRSHSSYICMMIVV